jgi:hypothetical protein
MITFSTESISDLEDLRLDTLHMLQGSILAPQEALVLLQPTGYGHGMFAQCRVRYYPATECRVEYDEQLERLATRVAPHELSFIALSSLRELRRSPHSRLGARLNADPETLDVYALHQDTDIVEAKLALFTHYETFGKKFWSRRWERKPPIRVFFFRY